MNILQYGKNSYFTKELRELGHTVWHVGESAGCELELTSVISAKRLLKICAGKGFVPDIFFYADDSSLPHIFGIEDLPVPCVFYSIDTYCHAWHGAFSYAFDHVLYAQAEEREKFMPCSEHFPLFAMRFNPEETKEEWFKNRDIPVAFVGTMGHKNNPDRHTFYTLFKAFQPIFITSGNFVPVFSRSKIILNQSAVGELNFRTFEAMALGCGCLADNMPTKKNRIGEIFDFGVNSLPAYPRLDVAKAVDLCRHWLSKEKEDDLYRVAMQGRKLVREKHSARARSLRLEELFHTLLAEDVRLVRQKNLGERKKNIAEAFSFLARQTAINAEFVQIYAHLAEKCAQSA